MIDSDFENLLNELEMLKTAADRYEYSLLIKILKSFIVFLYKIDKFYLLREERLLKDFITILKTIKILQSEMNFADMFVELLKFFENRYQNISEEYSNIRHLRLYYSVFKNELKFFLEHALEKNDIYKGMVITKINSELLSEYSYKQPNKINIETDII